MATIKCIGCFGLLRKELDVGGEKAVVYNCHRFPYMCAMAGLLKPGKGISRAVKACPYHPLGHCVLCSRTKIIHYDQNIVSVCIEHYTAWAKWLDEHPERRAHMAPRGRSVKANWVEVFREFIEDSRSTESQDIMELGESTL